ncbi:MAG: MoxR family ATPase [Gemmatimonadota bacterium]
MLSRLIDQVEVAFHGKRDVVRLATVAVLARGHILLEDVPGVGKTTLAQAMARALGLSFQRVQFTSDLLPSDVLGVSIYNPTTTGFEIRRGPIFTNIVLADEINRAPPRTQSGLLQAMQEGHVTIDDETLALPEPFLVMATQNPLEHHGTYPLPESQMDRFLMRISIGYPDEAAERKILLGAKGARQAAERVEPVLAAGQLLRLQALVDEVHAEESLVDHLMEIVRRTRSHPGLRAGASPRGAVALFRAARAHALLDNRDFLAPDDIRRLVVPCLAHRLLPAGTAGGSREAHRESAALLEELLDEVEPPV